MSLIPELGGQRRVDLCEFEVSLVYSVSSRTAKEITQKTLSQTKKREEKGEKEHIASAEDWSFGSHHPN